MIVIDVDACRIVVIMVFGRGVRVLQCCAGK